MAFKVTISRQRVPMLDVDTLEDRTRPALDGSASSRLRYFRWPIITRESVSHIVDFESRPIQARLGGR